MTTELGANTVIGSVLVANRGEIARRVFRTCRELGISTVAVFADPDADAPFVREADAAVRLPGAVPADTYLRGDLVIAAARAAGADAVHPGYGFLSENAEFAQAVLDAGLTWIGPPPSAIAAMGVKTRAKELMADAGVPVLTVAGEPTHEDLPLLVKAAAGGGGRGMRVVRELGRLDAELATARQEALAAFGSDEVFVEPYVETGRHVEVQLLADAHGTVWAVGERDCSIQRRHQKVVEEAPAPLLAEDTRARLHEAARAAARAIGYVGAGTAEFLLAPDGRFFFLEMNTRLQVEHPVTECVTGLDLVALQLLVAEGGPLPSAEPPAPLGHAIEVRLYAEDPARDWQPQTGTVERLDIPGVTGEFAPPRAGERAGLRLDSGAVAGSEVGVHYDAMLAKVIAWAPTRAEAARRLAGALERARVHGLTTNRDLLVRILRHPEFLAGRVDTAFLTRHPGAGAPEKDVVALAALAAALGDAAANAVPIAGGWRNVPAHPQVKRYAHEGVEHEVRYRLTRDGLRAEAYPDVALVAAAPDRVVLEVEGVRRTFGLARYDCGRGVPLVHVDSPLGAIALTVLPRFPEPERETAAGSLLAPMPGTVVRVEAAVGHAVTAGQPLLWLEAMKMQHRITAPTDGVVTQLRAAVGQQVDTGALLAVIGEPTESSANQSIASQEGTRTHDRDV
ncbi:acetyl/propionyl/methylcrotonyl-CoA carboxylase subunit alpha [Streptacidiphilus neutrinimicus]|uniref:acetyl/propionyl/methylcrotonyl-CoA carboxylase subunit alpha n=1 Tax=Streptacidiphilus neutrinimicus TaxID=105420 RepID=UPI000694F380|nr:biotin carboxylase N-terminal domain-containing protein [Streptacidiphilus neutrinimicus]